ncbi:regulatory LuxR family protein [Actinomycetospora succinea]|uniref:Regulatory LuxR family protein n=1 Tax=Actinomycetospora succinea TaxID=663603 RepID=A0A4R6ULB3_9PSEU|nr:LuxR family transcriptional regulator [Actinomycetospora succinea]TDQ47808.1 regulatory LuxR family protein [Actinomycetospora succinea]
MTSRPDPAWSRRAVTTPVFVGRRGPLAVVDQAWEDAGAGRPAVVWVEGEAGAGKTAFLARAVAGRRASAVLTATGDAAETALAHGLLDQLVAGLPPGLLDRFPLLRPDRAPRADPLAVGADLLGALGAVPDDDPVLVVLDDLQWADPASVRALVFALRRLRHDRVLVLAGLRHPGAGPGDAAESGHAQDAWWERLPATGETIRRVRLEGLDPGELSELAAALGRPLGSTGAAERLWRHTRGHPLHARTLLEELPAEVLAGTADVLPAPRSLPSVLLVRLARAAPATEALVVAAAVLGESAPLALAGAVAGLDDPADALDEAVGLGLVEELPGGPPVRIGFVHPLVRAAVRGDLPPTRRRALHAAAAARMAGRAALDHRIAAAAGPDPALATEIEELVAAPGAALAGAEAADLLRAAADLSTDPDERERRLLAATSRLIGDGEIARAVALTGAVEGCRPGPWRSAVLGQLALFTGRFGVAREWFEAALATAPDESGEERPGDRARAGAAAHLAILHLLHGDPERAVATAGVALSQGARGDDVRLPGGLALVLGLAALGRGADARAVLDRATGTDGRPPLVDALIVRGMLAALAGDDPAAAVDLDEAVQRARAGEPVRGLALALAFRPAVADRTGAPDGVIEGFELAVTLARDGGTALPGALAHAFAAEALAVRGRAADARAHLAAAAAAGPRWWGVDVCAAIAAARLAEVSDDPAGVLEALAPTRDEGVRALADGLGMLAPRVLETEALLALGRRGEAAASLAALEERAAGRHRIDVARLRLALEGGRPRSVAETGVGDVAAPHAIARLETEIGRRLLAAGERRAGVDLLRGARDTLARLGAAPWRARCDELLHTAGLTPARADSDDGALGLTPHEEAVVALVARGLTNREIGRDLYITPRTVAYHLSNVYAKLGVASRRELMRLHAT